MTLHYHGTPITPRRVLYEIAGRHYCVSHAQPQDVRVCHEVGQSVMLDNGAFSAWRVGRAVDWPGYYEWTDRWLDYPTTWAVIPDVITGDENEQDELIAQWPHGFRGAPVWHMHERLDRLMRLIEEWPRVCIGSSAQYAQVLSERWERRMDETFNEVARRHKRIPWLHMLRGMATVGRRWPFASVDSTDIARNHSAKHNSALAMANRWDPVQCPATWAGRPEQLEIAL